ncbi:GNAT family N-acetyltransferase [Streptomyces sp. enrichment culture]|uniref:GNAT family N-acetyltransferase n=1 Tax=Streptomyces sp. enrichment culture TaxID=1795815 RepID=UPI003F57DEBA
MPHTASRFLAEGPRVGVRLLTRADGPEFAARARESKDLHHPWLFPPDSVAAFAGWADRLIDDASRVGFLVCEKGEAPGEGRVEGAAAGGAIAGFININNIVHGAFRCGALGYGAFAHAAGRGLMREGLGLVVDHAFGPMRLHRLEINVQPGNAASIALARSCGFRLEGYSPNMLFVDGAWRDHERWALTAEMRTSG